MSLVLEEIAESPRVVSSRVSKDPFSEEIRDESSVFEENSLSPRAYKAIGYATIATFASMAYAAYLIFI